MSSNLISAFEREAVYKTIFSRRDVRREFLAKDIPDEVLKRILTAAHHAPSVGFMQPWDFIVIKETKIKQNIKTAFTQAHHEAKKIFETQYPDKSEQYQSLKLEGIMEAPIGICVTCDKTRHGPVVLGRTANPEMDVYSSVCAVQNLWLAARAENIGIGWVSIIHNESLKKILNIPSHIIPIAYLCVGYVSSFNKTPDLERLGWLQRENLENLIHYNQWSK